MTVAPLFFSAPLLRSIHNWIVLCFFFLLDFSDLFSSVSQFFFKSEDGKLVQHVIAPHSRAGDFYLEIRRSFASTPPLDALVMGILHVSRSSSPVLPPASPSSSSSSSSPSSSSSSSIPLTDEERHLLARFCDIVSFQLAAFWEGRIRDAFHEGFYRSNR